MPETDALLATRRRLRDYKRTCQAQGACPPDDEVVQLWMLRILLDLGGLHRVMSSTGFNDESIGRYLGLASLMDRQQEKFDYRAARRLLITRHEALEYRAEALSLPAVLRRNLDRLSATFGFDHGELQVLGFVALINSERMLDDVADSLGQLSGAQTRRVLSQLLGLSGDAVSQCLDPRGRLVASGMLAVEGHPVLLRQKLRLTSDAFADRLVSGDVDPAALMRSFFLRSPPGHLGLSDFEHLKYCLDLLLPYLRRALAEQRRGVHICMHGAPGTGKTQLAKAVASALGVALYEVSSEDEDGDPLPGGRRFFGLRAAQQALAAQGVLLLFDEVEDVLGTGGNPFHEAVVDDNYLGRLTTTILAGRG